jgi:hypothetical protein
MPFLLFVLCSSAFSFTLYSLRGLEKGRRNGAGVGDGRLGVEDKRDNEAVETENFGENEDKDHTDVQAGLLGSTAYTGVTDDTDGKAGGETGETDRETGAELDETCVQGHRRLEVTRDEDGHDEAVLGSVREQLGDADTRQLRTIPMIPAMTTGMVHLISRSGRRTPMAEIPTPDLAVP